ncbi:MAG TPA: alpha/beta hydrolase [Allosphingosinicella sp.]|jgi:pimeloyl-ACP methyl ester carboxylesterase|nr:alpha/beta hydrolase [Allosphingosinicella sp.]
MRLALLLALAAPIVALPAAPTAAAEAFAPTRFTVEVTGTGPDVILIPGLTASKNVWRPTVAAVPGYRYHLIQVSGFAGAPARGNAQGDVVAPLADEIARYIRANHLGRPAIVGHSMGGTLALMLAERHPDVAGKVMVVDMLPQPAELLGASPSGIRGFADTLRDLSGTPLGKSLIESAIRVFGNDGIDNLKSDPDVVARATHELALTDLTPELPRVIAPLTILYASPEPALGPAADGVYREAYAGDPAAHLVRIDGSGHMIMADQPRRFEEELRKFLASN